MSINLSELAELQRLAATCTQTIAQYLEPGMSEATAASLMRQWLHEQGISLCAHRALAWFGPRAHLIGQPRQSNIPSLRPVHFPTQQSLRKGDAISLYCAPQYASLVAESLYCDSLGLNPRYQQLRAKVSHLKSLLLQAINARLTLNELSALLQHIAQTQAAQLAVGGITGGWIRPYSATPNIGNYPQGILAKVVDLSGHTPAHLPAAAPFVEDQPLSGGLWVVQPWLDDGQQAAGLRELLYIGQDGHASWLDTHAQQQAA